jgi:hypothetical protein
MKTMIWGALAACVMALGACDTPLTPTERTAVGLAGGAAAGLIAADVLEADDDWRLISALAGAAAGTVVARNQSSGMCAYARGDGSYYRAPCPG